jgi:hypothetical protein
MDIINNKYQIIPIQSHLAILCKNEAFLKYYFLKYIRDSIYHTFSNKHIDDKLPKIIQYKCNSNIDFSQIPKDTNLIILDNHYPQSFQDLNIEYLQLGFNFNQTIHHLPVNLKMLILPLYYNQPISFPESLQYLDLSQNYQHDCHNLPQNLQVLSVTINNELANHYILDNLPSSLLALSVITNGKLNLDNLPPNIQYLKISNNSITNNLSFNITNLPPNLAILELINIENIEPLLNLPANLEFVKLSYFNHKKDTFDKFHKNLNYNIFQNLVKQFYHVKPNIKFILVN